MRRLLSFAVALMAFVVGVGPVFASATLSVGSAYAVSDACYYDDHRSAARIDGAAIESPGDRETIEAGDRKRATCVSARLRHAPDLVAPNSITGARGPASGRLYDPGSTGGPVRSLDPSRAHINSRGTYLVEAHLNRFADGGQIAKPEAEVLGRLRAISNGELSPTVFDQNFYTHELRKMVRYRQLGYRAGQPPGEAGYTLWNNVHTATLED